MSQQPVPRDSEPPTASSGLSCKAFFWGCVLSLSAAIGALHSTFINASWMALNISVPIAFFVFALFAGLVNPLLGLVHRRLMLRRAELGVVFIMAMMAATVPTEGYVEHMVPKIASVFYYATPENDWVDLIHPYMKGWFAPLDGEAVQHFFEGAPAGVPIPWGAWIQPLCYWALFFLTLCFVMVCTMVILRRQWIDHERLVYPLVKLPLEMIEEDGSLMRPFFRNPIMWLGFSIPFALLSLDALHSYYNFIPALVLDTSAIGAEGLAALGMTYAWILKVRIFAMAACANALKLDGTSSGTARAGRWGHGAADAGAALLFVVAAASGRLSHRHDLGYESDLDERLLGVGLQERGVEVRRAWIVQTDSAIFLGIGSGQCGCRRRVVSN